MSKLQFYVDLQEDSASGALQRTSEYADMVESYYSFATGFYEATWGDSFHFAPRRKGEPFPDAVVRSQHWLAAKLLLGPGMKALDLGCGIGGPMRTIARFTDAAIEGVTISRRQLIRGQRLNRKADLAWQCHIAQGDYMNLPYVDNSFDAAYEINALVHSPDMAAAFAQIFRVLKPGTHFGGYSWGLSRQFDGGNPHHRQLKRDIERGCSILQLIPTDAIDKSLEQAGFEIVETHDYTTIGDPEHPWYHPLIGKGRGLRGMGLSPVGRYAVRRALAGGEKLHLWSHAPAELTDLILRACDALHESGKLGILSSHYFYLARKPDHSESQP
ncbi:class I SAM-dependent methyltransferase [Nocardia brasiliensis]|uniref:class I SAM-dependent methyltransferase n=1 Tax=Nocardia brasiliensis TaxID=37326 RepID=UPI002454BDF0|nr:class I SAM-dependent methyltransferase [Nocardia brasiliensis]